jgi:flagellum-specific peptidoglycan hydrolase FlgJ
MGFIEQIAPIVQKYAKQYNILCPSAVIAQAVLESASGTSELATNAHNYFGLKYRGGRCPTAETEPYYKIGSEQDSTTGQYISSNMAWFKFADMDKGVKGYFDFINISNYSNLKGITDPQTYLETIKADKYCTSVKYVENCMAVIKKYNLTKYDTPENTKKYYRVQVGAYKSKANAEKMVIKLKTDGFSPIIKYVDNLYKCQLNAFSNKANAELFLKTVKSKGYDAFIVYN